jgi:hypothetical protein
MRFQFDANLTRQTDSLRVKVGMYEGDIETVAFVLDDERLLSNLQKVQAANNIAPDLGRRNRDFVR